MKRNRILSFVISLTMLSGVPAFARDYKTTTTLNSWNISYGEPTEAQQGMIAGGYIPSTDEMRNASVTTEDKRSGEYSIKFVNTRLKKQNYTFTEFAPKTDLTPKAGEYTVEFYLKGDFDENGIFVGFGDIEAPATGGFLKLSARKSGARIFSAEADGEWTKYSGTLPCKEGEKFHIKSTHKTTVAYLDDVKVYGENQTNMLSDGGFEDVTVEQTEVPKGEDYSTLENYHNDYPRGVFVYSGGTLLEVSWQNAASANIKSVGIYETVNGEDVLVSNDNSKTSGAWCTAKIEGLDADAKYYYKLVTEFTDGRKTEYLFSNVSSYAKSPTAWVANYEKNASWTSTPGRAAVDENVAHSGEASVRLFFRYSQQSSLYVNFKQAVALKKGHKYRFSFWTRAEEANTWSTSYAWSKYEGYPGDRVYVTEDKTHGWKKYEFIKVPDGSENGSDFMINIDRPTYAIWLDDFECYELDENGNKIGENLIKNPDFESDVINAEPTPIASLTGEGGDGKATLSWSKSDDAYIKLYMLVDGKYVNIGTFDAAGKNNITVSSLGNDTEYTFAVSSVSASLVESEKTICKVATVAPQYRIGKASLNGDGKVIAGDNKVKIKLENIKQPDGFKAEVMAFVKKGNMIVKAAAGKFDLAQGASEDVELTLNIPNIDDGDYTISAYVWDDFETMNILSPYTLFTE